MSREIPVSYGIEKALKERRSAVIVPTGNSMRPLLWPDQDSAPPIIFSISSCTNGPAGTISSIEL